MVTRQDFVASVMAAPDDDLRRLAFADWLEEHDEPERAGFVRVQIELTRRTAADDRGRGLAAREAALFAAHGAAWAAGLPRTALTLAAWQRGFLDRAEFGAQAFSAEVSRFADREPVARVGLYLNLDAAPDVDDTAWVEALAADPNLRLVTKLDGPNSGFGPDRFATLIASPHLTRLREVDLFEDWIGAAGVRAVCASPAAARLRKLSLNGVIGDEFAGGGDTADALAAVETLAACPALAGLESLSLYYNGLRDASVRALIASPHLSRSLRLEFQEDDWEPEDDLADALAARFVVV